MLRSRFRFYIWLFVLANSALFLLFFFWPMEILDFLSQSQELSDVKGKENVKAGGKDSLDPLQLKYIQTFIRMAAIGIFFISFILLRVTWDPNAHRGLILRISLYFLSMGALGTMILLNVGLQAWILAFTVFCFVLFLFLFLFASYNLRVRD